MTADNDPLFSGSATNIAEDFFTIYLKLFTELGIFPCL